MHTFMSATTMNILGAPDGINTVLVFAMRHAGANCGRSRQRNEDNDDIKKTITVRNATGDPARRKLLSRHIARERRRRRT